MEKKEVVDISDDIPDDVSIPDEDMATNMNPEDEGDGEDNAIAPRNLNFGDDDMEGGKRRTKKHRKGKKSKKVRKGRKTRKTRKGRKSRKH